MNKYISRLLTETLGSFILTLICFLPTIQPQNKFVFSVMLFVVFGFSYCFCFRTSGAHFNPMISLGFISARKLSWKDFLLDLIAHLLGIVAGAAIYIFANSSNYQQIIQAFNLGNYYLSIPLSIFIIVASYLIMTCYFIVYEKNIQMIFSGFFIGAILALISFFEPSMVQLLSINPFYSAICVIYSTFEHVDKASIITGICYVILPFIGMGLAILTYYIYQRKFKKNV